MFSRNYWPPLDESMRSLLPILRSRMELRRGSIGQLLGEQRHCCMGLNVVSFISKMYFSHWEPPGVSERRRSVNLEASISGENQTLGGHSARPSE